MCDVSATIRFLAADTDKGSDCKKINGGQLSTSIPDYFAAFMPCGGGGSDRRASATSASTVPVASSTGAPDASSSLRGTRHKPAAPTNDLYRSP